MKIVVMLGWLAIVSGCGDKKCIESPILEGSVHIQNASEIDEIRSCQEITGNLEIQAQGLSAVQLPSLRSVGVQLIVNSPNGLRETDFGSLAAVGGGVDIVECDELPTLTGFRALTSIDGDLQIYQNDELSSLGLTSLTHVGGNVTIAGSPSLPTCAAQALVAQLVDFTGTVTISGNNDTTTCP